MDLDMIQDLLGGSNLPPPPSVQDLLCDVVPIPPSPSPPPTSLPGVQLSAEHSYSKTPMESAEGTAEPMEDGASTSPPGSQTLLPLNSSTDCYEAFLLNLLRVYTQNRASRGGGGGEGDITASGTPSQTPDMMTSGSAEGFPVGSISPEAINSLSQEQVQSLVTSNSMNYDVIHQILAYRQRLDGGGVGGGGGGAPVDGERAAGGCVGTGVSSEGETGEEKPADDATSTLQQLQALQLTPEQLKQIQMQMAELIRTKQIVLPTELSMEQQQQLLQSLILKQVRSQHTQLASPPPPVTTTVAASQPTVPMATSPTGTKTPVTQQQSARSTPTTTGGGSGGTLVAMLRGDAAPVEKQESGSGSGGRGGKAVKMEVPPPSTQDGGNTRSSVALQLSPNPVAEGNTPAPAPAVTTRSGGRKKRDPDEPKKPSSPYGIFFSDVYPSVLQANPRMSFSEASKLISSMWNAMGVDTKKQYHERTERQKEAYQAYLASHKQETPPLTPTDVPATTTHPQTQTDVGSQPLSTSRTTKTVQVEVVVAAAHPEEEQQNYDPVDTDQPLNSHPPPPSVAAAVPSLQSQPQPKVVVKDLRHCINDGCFKDAVHSEFRGPRYCSNECVVQHCRSVFQEWVAQRKMAA